MDAQLIDDTNFFIVPVDTSFKGFAALFIKAQKILLVLLACVAVPGLILSVLAAIINTFYEYNQSKAWDEWLTSLLFCLIPLFIWLILKRRYKSAKALHHKNSLYLFDSGFAGSRQYLSYADIPEVRHARILNDLYARKLPYTDLYAVLESKNSYFILIARNSGYTIRKSDCSPNAQAFLCNLKTAVNSRKKRKK